MAHRTAPVLILAAAGVLALPGGAALARGPHPHPAFTCAPAVGGTIDFDGDGQRDLAVGAPYAKVGGKAGAGAAIILYNGHAGLGANVVVVSQATSGVVDSPEAGDHFGSSLAAADFDCDGFTDLAVGAPDEDRNGFSNVGGVNFLWGSASGLVGDGATAFLPVDDGSLGVLADGRSGAGLAALDVVVESGGGDGSDGIPDLAIGIPGGGAEGKGAVYLFHGGIVNRDGPGGGTQSILLIVSDGSHAGAVLVAGDLDVNPTDDLVIGVPNAQSGAGAVAVATNGTSVSVWQRGDELPGTPEANEHLGASIAVGDVNGDGAPEIAIGVPDRDAGATDAGQVIVIGGTLGGPDTAVRTVLTQATRGVPGSAASGDRFGASLAIAQLGKRSKADLAIGVPGKAVGGKVGAGSVVVLYSDGSWFGTNGNQQWTQASGGVADNPEPGDGFGGALLARELGGGTPADLAIGVARENLGATIDAGGLLVLYSAGADGLVTGDATWFTKASVDSGTLAGRARLGTTAR